MRGNNIIALKIGGGLAFLGLMVAKLSVNTACVIWFHQPKVPESLDRFKKLRNN